MPHAVSEFAEVNPFSQLKAKKLRTESPGQTRDGFSTRSPNPRLAKSTPRENVLLNHTLEITPLEAPLFPLPYKSTISPRSYLTPSALPFGRRLADWQNEFFGLGDKSPQYRTTSFIEPLRPDAPTLIVILYPDNDHESVQRRRLENYEARLARLASMNEQTMIYCPPSLSHTIRGLRADQHWHIVDDFEDVWQFPNNCHQKHNFTHLQPALFEEFECKAGFVGWEPEQAYNHPHRSAVYNAKAFVTYDAVMRNPFGSDRWMYMDAGLFDEFGPEDSEGRLWGDILCQRLSSAKFDRSISVSRDSGIVMGEYMQSLCYGAKDINHPCWTDPKKSWLCHHFIAQTYVGNSLGMLNYSVRFMQTVEDLDANDFYTAREEFVIPHVAVRYPNTIFSIPWKEMEWGAWAHPVKGCYTTYGGEESVPAIMDPLEGAICKGYQSQKASLEGAGAYEWERTRKRMRVFGRRY